MTASLIGGIYPPFFSSKLCQSGYLPILFIYILLLLLFYRIETKVKIDIIDKQFKINDLNEH